MNYGEVIGDLFEDVIGGIGDNFSANAQDNQAKVNLENAKAQYILSKAQGDKQVSTAYTKAIQIAVGGLVAALIIFVLSKYLIPKLK